MVLLLGHFALSKSLFSHKVWNGSQEDSIVHSHCYNSQSAYECDTVWRLWCYIMENRIIEKIINLIKIKIINLGRIMRGVNEKKMSPQDVNSQPPGY